MAAKLKPGSTVRREVLVRGFEVPLVITVTPETLRITLKGSRVGLEQEWPEVIRRMPTPNNIPASFFQRPYELLQNLVQKRKKL